MLQHKTAPTIKTSAWNFTFYIRLTKIKIDYTVQAENNIINGT